MSDARVEFITIISDLSPCPEVELVREIPSLQDGWVSPTFAKESMKWWFVDTFLDAETAKRMRRATDSVDSLFARLSRLSGKAPNRRLVEAIKSAVLEGWFPGVQEIVEQARKDDSASIAQVRVALIRHMEGKWRTRY